MSSYDWEDLGIAIVVAIFALVLAFFEAILGVWLWRKIMVEIFNLPYLTFWQFYGLTVLIHIIFPGRTVKVKEKN
jgi:hypothetical protein